MRIFMIMSFNLDESLKALRAWLPELPRAAVVLGSGIAQLSDTLEGRISRPMSDFGLPQPHVPGHNAMLHFGRMGGLPVLMAGGRIHAYEGYTMAETTLYVRLLAAVGVKNLILTNAAGAVNQGFNVGDIVCISDHIKLVAESPLSGEIPAEFRTRFVDLGDAYSAEMREKAALAAEKCGVKLQNGVYMYFAGPNYETPAEIRMARLLGADLVGMSTVSEVIMAAALGMKTLAFSVVSNMAAGISEVPLSHEEIKDAFGKTAPQMQSLLAGILRHI